jgi:ligand-binding sensor domain-containing protein
VISFLNNPILGCYIHTDTILVSRYTQRYMFYRQLIFLLSLVLLAGICPLKVHGQSFSYLGIEQGLSNSTVTTIYKDNHGFMWFGTFDGLNRFDGYNFTRFRNRADDTTSIPDNYVTGLQEDSRGNLWVATRKGIGVLSARLLNMSYVRYNDGNLEAACRVIEKPVNALKRDSDANIYIGSNELGLLIAKGGSSVASQIPLLMNSKPLFQYSVPALCIDKNNNVWFLADELGLFVLEAKSMKVSLVSTLIKSGNAMKVSADGRIWIGTNNVCRI